LNFQRLGVEHVDVHIQRQSVEDGSIASVGSGFRPCGINGLEVVALNGASWNHIVAWLRAMDQLRTLGRIVDLGEGTRENDNCGCRGQRRSTFALRATVDNLRVACQP